MYVHSTTTHLRYENILQVVARVGRLCIIFQFIYVYSPKPQMTPPQWASVCTVLGCGWACYSLLVPCLALCLPVPEQSQAIVIYTGWERHALVGSDIRLSCSFFSWRWTSEDVTFSWTYRPDGSRDSISVMHAFTHTNHSYCMHFLSGTRWVY